MELPEDNKLVDEQALRTLKHDVKNQLSNINLAIEQLRYELENPTTDCIFYMDTIASSCTAINNMMKNIG
jgi:nitrogen fixation/metabolism regulation signal transduction histidine kinase